MWRTGKTAETARVCRFTGIVKENGGYQRPLSKKRLSTKKFSISTLLCGIFLPQNPRILREEEKGTERAELSPKGEARQSGDSFD